MPTSDPEHACKSVCGLSTNRRVVYSVLFVYLRQRLRVILLQHVLMSSCTHGQRQRQDMQ